MSPPADLVFRHGAVYTVDAARSWAEAIAVRNGRIVYVGTDSGVTPFIGHETRVVDLQGRMLLPGFHDSHVHPISGGIELGECTLTDLTTETQILDTIRAYAARHPQEPWIRGNGWQLPIFPNANPSKALLDELIPDRPAYFSAADAHSAWVNSRALELAGITHSTPDPAGGRIERDPRTGEATGTLRESATGLVERLLPEHTAEDYEAALRRALGLANRLGIIGMIEADADEPKLAAYAAMAHAGRLTARVVASMHTEAHEGLGQIARLEEWRARYSATNFRPVAAKIFADGVIEARTAALLEPYLGTSHDRGELGVQADTLDALVAALDRHGFQIHVHAIGDWAIRQTLDALEKARTTNGTHDSRPIIAHLELIDPADIPRFRALGVIASFQPLWAYPDEYITELTEPKLGPARSRWLYPIESVLRTGAVMAAGSDWSVSSLDPLEAIQVAVTRRAPDSAAGPAWIPEERATLAEMIAAYTIQGAWASRTERFSGSIEVGKDADLVVLDQNLFTLPPEKIHTARVLLTFLGGREVYGDERLKD